mgnify:FL=1|tara:strand:+ start:362 stop:1018 length:657 start_codon:yes stop_codon:yes gene_type:complete
METNDLDQRSPEWFAARLGKITASGFNNVLKKTKYGESEYKKNYRMQLAIERLTGTQAVIVPMNLAMRNGVEREPEAREVFSKATNLQVKECGVYIHPLIKNSGASPDGIIQEDYHGETKNVVLEIKCPTMMTHAKNIMHDTLPKQYLYQIMWQIACTNSDGAYWASYNPEFTEETKLKYLYIPADQKLIKEMEDEAIKFDNEVDELVEILKLGAKHG